MNETAGQALKEPEIKMLLGRLHNRIEDAGKSFASLQERITSVLNGSPCPPSVEVGKKSYCATTELSETLYGVIEKIEKLTSDIRSTQAKVEL